MQNILSIEECMKSNIMISGTNAQGKSLCGMAISDLLMRQNWQIIVIDGTGIWKQKSSIPYYQVISETTMKFYLTQESIIYDTSRLLPSYQREFIENLLSEIWLSRIDQPTDKWLLIVLEESHLFMRHIRGRASENLLRICSVGRNVRIRTLAISPSFVGLDAEFRRLSQQRYHFKIPNEANTKRRFCSIYSKDWYRCAKELDVGFCIYYLNEKMKITKIPLFISQRKPQPFIKPEPEKKGFWKTVLSAFANGHSEESTSHYTEHESEDDDIEEDLALLDDEDHLW